MSLRALAGFISIWLSDVVGLGIGSLPKTLFLLVLSGFLAESLADNVGLDRLILARLGHWSLLFGGGETLGSVMNRDLNVVASISVDVRYIDTIDADSIQHARRISRLLNGIDVTR